MDTTIEKTLEWWTEDKWVEGEYFRDDKFCALGAIAYQIEGLTKPREINTLVSHNRTGDGGMALRNYLFYLGGNHCVASVSNDEGHAASVAQLKLIAENFRAEKAKILADA